MCSLSFTKKRPSKFTIGDVVKHKEIPQEEKYWGPHKLINSEELVYYQRRLNKLGLQKYASDKGQLFLLTRLDVSTASEYGGPTYKNLKFTGREVEIRNGKPEIIVKGETKIFDGGSDMYCEERLKSDGTIGINFNPEYEVLDLSVI